MTPFGLYKILFDFEAFVHESILLLLAPPTCIARTIAIPLHVNCAIYDTPRTPLLYAIHHTRLVSSISCKGDTVRHYARRMGQPTQRATNYTARSNTVTAQIFLHANGQRPNRAMIRQRSGRRLRRREPHTEHGLGVRASSTDSTRSTHFTLTQRHR